MPLSDPRATPAASYDNSWGGLAGIDTTPVLLPDIHPYWGPPVPNVVVCNPYWKWCDPTQTYNTTLYLDPTVAIINPPGTHSTSLAGFDWIDGFTPPALRATYDPQGPNDLASFGPWCQGRGSNGLNEYVLLGSAAPFDQAPKATAVSLEHQKSSGELPFFDLPGGNVGSNVQPLVFVRKQ